MSMTFSPTKNQVFFWYQTYIFCMSMSHVFFFFLGGGVGGFTILFFSWDTFKKSHHFPGWKTLWRAFVIFTPMQGMWEAPEAPEAPEEVHEFVSLREMLNMIMMFFFFLRCWSWLQEFISIDSISIVFFTEIAHLFPP